MTDDRIAIREAHQRFYASHSPIDALDYLIAVRDFIQNQKAPQGYIQYAHSRDPNPVGGDKTRPALTNACYEHFGRYRASLDWPLFVGQDYSAKTGLPWEIEADNQVKPIWGFNGVTLASSMESALSCLGVRFKERNGYKVGYDAPLQIWYVESTVKDEADFHKAHEIIGTLVHGNAESDRLLRQRVLDSTPESNLPPRQPPKKAVSVQNLWRQLSGLTKPLANAIGLGPSRRHRSAPASKKDFG